MRKVSVIGLGKVGLPLALAITKGDYKVSGVDISRETVDLVSRGVIPPQINEPGLDSLLASALKGGKFEATTDARKSLSTSDIVVVIVPLKLDSENKPDFTDLDSVTKDISECVRPDTLVVYETTLPVGTTRNRFARIIAAGQGTPIEKILVAFSPERIFSGAYLKTLATIPKIVGGINSNSTLRTEDFYQSFISCLTEYNNGEARIERVSDSETAEFIKIAETTYRDVNIALANTFAMHSVSLGLDFSEIRNACNTNSFSHIHKPSIWVGGHCIPVYPRLYMTTDTKADLISCAREINEKMPDFFVNQIMSKLGEIAGRLVLIKGITYRGNVKEVYMSGAFVLLDKISKLGARVVVEDPMYTDSELVALGFEVYNPKEVSPEVVIFHSDHSEYQDFNFAEMPHVKLFVDGRSFVRSESVSKERFFSLGSATDSYTPSL